MRLRGAYLEEGGSQYVIRQGSHSTFYLRALTQTRASFLNEEIYGVPPNTLEGGSRWPERKQPEVSQCLTHTLSFDSD